MQIIFTVCLSRGVMKNFIILLKSIHQFITKDIWRQDFSKLSRARQFIYRQILILYMVARSYFEDRLPVRASALVYSSLLSFVPLLAVTFSLLKGFGFHIKLEPTLRVAVEPLGEEAINFVSEMISKLDSLNLNAFGFTSLIILLLSVFSIVNNIERAFNDIWRIKKVRSIHRRFSDYAGVFLLIPILMLGVPFVNTYLQSLSIIQIMRQNQGFEWFITKSAPYIVSWIILFFLYIFVPNTKVKIGSAFFGAILAGTLWQVANIFFTRFIIKSYQTGFKIALYTSFATFLLFLIWLYLSWTVVLLGAEISYTHQNQKKISWEVRQTKYSYAFKESLALRIILFVAESFHNGENAPSFEELYVNFDIPERLLNEIIEELIELEFLYVIEKNDREIHYCPTTSLENVTVFDVIQAMRTFGVNVKFEKDEKNSKIIELENNYQKFLKESFGEKSIKDLLIM